MAVLKPELIQIIEESKRRYSGDGPWAPAPMREWLFRGGGYAVADSGKKFLSLLTTDDSWAVSNGIDVMRFFSAARESVLPRGASVYDNRSIGWASVSAYYAGFYLMLGLLRLMGRGLMYVPQKDCVLLANSIGVTPAFEQGVYSISIGLGSPPTVDLKKKNGGGFHGIFWRYADECLSEFANEISSGVGASRPFTAIQRAEAILSVEDFRKWLGAANAVGREVGWMSELRNEINYRLERRVWAPNYRDAGVTVDRLRQDMNGILRGAKDSLGPRLQLDRDVRAMIERVCILFRDVSVLSGFPN